MHSDYDHVAAVLLTDPEGRIDEGRRDGHFPVAHGERLLRSRFHVDPRCSGIQHVLRTDGLDDRGDGLGLAYAGDPSAHALDQLGVGDHSGPASVCGDDRRLDPPLLEGEAEGLGYPEGQEVPHADLPPLGAHPERLDAVLHVLTDGVPVELLYAPVLLEQGAVLHAGLGDLDHFAVLYDDAAQPQAFHHVAAHGITR